MQRLRRIPTIWLMIAGAIIGAILGCVLGLLGSSLQPPLNTLLFTLFGGVMVTLFGGMIGHLSKDSDDYVPPM